MNLKIANNEIGGQDRSKTAKEEEEGEEEKGEEEEAGRKNDRQTEKRQN